MKRLLFSLACLSSPVHAEGNAGAYRGSVAQDQLRLATAELEAQLGELAAEYGQYKAAAGEVEQLQAGIRSLRDLTGKSMPEVSALLLSASRAGDASQAKAELQRADEGQKRIQVKLREVADRLSRQAAAGAMRERIEQLLDRQTANLRKTRELAGTEGNDPHRLAARRAEQANLEQEIKLAGESLRQLAQAAEVAPALKTAAELAKQANLESMASEAVTVMEGNLAESVAKQASVRDALQTMMAALDAARPEEERAWEMAAQLAEVAAKERENSNKTRGTVDPEQAKDRRSEESEVTDGLETMQSRVAALDPALGEGMKQAQATSQSLAQQSTKEAFAGDPDFRTEMADAQRDFSSQLAELGRKLQDKAMAAQNAEALAGMSPQEQALRGAIDDLTEARAQSDAAYKLAARNEQGFTQPLDGTDAKVAEAREGLKGMQDFEAAVQKDLDDVQSRSAEARKGRAEHHIYRIREGIDRSLATLQNALNQMALADMSQQDASTGQGQGDGGVGKAAGKGGPGYAANAAAGKAQREALNLLQQEKVAPEYEEMVKEYIKKLAEE